MKTEHGPLTLSVEGYFSPREIKAIQSGKAMVFLELEDDAIQREFDVDKNSLKQGEKPYGVNSSAD
jgi:hypothetical protein|tara:strand:- start:1042 stop:1239 length:198 start_codon:yes stop_codon:yes gene_type:complete